MSKLETNTIDNISGSSTLTIGDSNTSTITLKSGATLTNFPDNTPAFEAYLSSAQSLSNNTNTLVQVDTEVFDTDSAYDNSTNYRFTPQIAGKYFVYALTLIQSGSANNWYYGWSYIRKNGGTNYIAQNTFDGRDGANGRAYTSATHVVVDMNGSSDYVDLIAYHNAAVTSSGVQVDAGLQKTKFGAYRIIGA